MSLINDPRYDIDQGQPDELYDAARCNCGQKPELKQSRGFWSRYQLKCPNARCGFQVSGEDLAETVALWNKETAIAKCEKHSWVSNEADDGFHCCFCPLKLNAQMEECE